MTLTNFFIYIYQANGASEPSELVIHEGFAVSRNQKESFFFIYMYSSSFIV